MAALVALLRPALGGLFGAAPPVSAVLGLGKWCFLEAMSRPRFRYRDCSMCITDGPIE